VQSSPFGLHLTGFNENDRDRIQIRIAAQQAGLAVDVMNGGQVVAHGELTPLQRMVIDQLHAIERNHQEQHGNSFHTAALRPLSFDPTAYGSPAQIQERIPRKEEESNG
jgi:hypothetical protein